MRIERKPLSSQQREHLAKTLQILGAGQFAYFGYAAFVNQEALVIALAFATLASTELLALRVLGR